ncbi:MAG: NnrS family protein [Candidatus Omnitrophica bacterium]|nr:NnrS family protein [Candidatus Omnitrophota bacterium]
MLSWLHLRREPYRIFFPLGVLFGLLGVGHWLGYAMGGTAVSAFHARIQIGAYLYSMVAGFLMTAMPRFSATHPATTGEVLMVLSLLIGEVVSVSVGWWGASSVCWIGLLISLLVFAARRFARRGAAISPPTEFLWVPIGVVCGLLGSVLTLGGLQGDTPVWVTAMARPLTHQGFLLAVVVGIAGFMAPRLLGRETLLIAPAGLTAQHAQQVRRRRLAIHLVSAMTFLFSFALEGLGWMRPAYLLRAAVVTALWEWLVSLHRPPRATALYARLLWVSLWMVVLGLWGAGLFPRYRLAMLHLMFVGGFSLMAFAVGTMVVLSHAGESQRLKHPMWALQVVTVGIGTATAARVLADLWPLRYFPLLATASIAWLVAGISWLVLIAPYVARPVPEGTFERLHEEAKQRLAMVQ